MHLIILVEHHFLSDILVPFPDLNNLYGREENKNKGRGCLINGKGTLITLIVIQYWPKYW